MFGIIRSLLLIQVICAHNIHIPFIANVTLIPRYRWNSTTVNDQTIQQCFCLSMPSFVAFNWYPNNTCQLFYTFPLTYKIQSTPGARLYFSQGIFPNASQCCMPDLNFLLQRLNNATRTYVNVSQPRNLLIDSQGYLVTVQIQTMKIVRFNTQTLTLIDQTTIPGRYAMTIGFSNNAYFVGLIDGIIVILDSQNLTILNQVTSSQILDLRSIVFLQNGNIMLVSSIQYNKINFFRRINNGSFNYILVDQQSVSYIGLHGLTVVNDNLFYATSYSDNVVYSYSAILNGSSWNERLFIDGNSFGNMYGITFVVIDECDRYWVSSDAPILYIFDRLGSLIGSLNINNTMIMDTLIADNYVMYFSDQTASWNRIIRIDPDIQC